MRRTRRSALFLGLVVLTVPALAGCMTAQAAAMQYEPAAQDRATAWDPDAELAGIFGVEGAFSSAWMGGFTPWSSSSSSSSSGWGSWGSWGSGTSDGARAQSSHPFSQGDYWQRTSQDDNVGDGRCEFWVYAYVAEGRDEAYVVVVDRDGNVLDEGTVDRDTDMVPVGEVNVDSDRALEIAKENNEGLRQGVESDNFAVVSALHREQGEDHATWLIAGGGGDSSGGGGGMVVIDAVTGEVLESQGGFSSR